MGTRISFTPTLLWAIASSAFIGCGGAVTSGDENSAQISSAATGEQDLHGAPEHVQLDKGHANPFRPPSSPLMTSHGGTILPTNVTHAIFWGSQWASPAFAGDKITGMDSFFTGFGASNYAAASSEYTGSNGQVTSASIYGGSQLDLSAAPSKAPSVSAAVAEVCKVTGNTPDPNGVYFLFTATGAGHVNYCAWHSWGSCGNGAAVQVAYMPNIDGLAGCDPVDDYNTGHSQGLTALANVTAHELSEAITDPRGSGWFDSSGQENGDKCAWSFHGPVLLRNGTVWKLQMEWSNAKYPNGYANRSGQLGCLQGECTPATCAAQGACGSISDGCGGTLDCGSCVDPQTCGGAGIPNVCGP